MKTYIRTSRKPRQTALASLTVCLLSAAWVVGPVAASPSGTAASTTTTSVNANADEPSGGPVFDVLFIAGSTFRPTESSTSYSYEGGGCISKTGGSPVFHRKVVLPNGALVKYMRIYSYDTSTSAIIGFFTTYNGAGAFNEISNVASVNAAGGYGSQLAPEMTYTVDRFTSSINIAINMGTQNDSTLRFCGVRIAYYGEGITDRIFASGFESNPL